MSKKSMSAADKKQVDELSEDMEVVGPGQMLSEARKKLSLSTEYVAEKLKFKNDIVQNIEQDLFDQKLPTTFNRGYLRSYAKLVNIDVAEVLSAYDMLGVAEVQRSEMQSFSNLTEKEAEHSRIMWLSYFIAAILIGLMILWWQQEPKQTVDEKIPEAQTIPMQLNSSLGENNNADLVKQESTQLITEKSAVDTVKKLPLDKVIKQEVGESQVIKSTVVTHEDVSPDNTLDSVSKENEKSVVEVSTAVFTFSGDCWVNIYDATGERIAWGVKKSGYVMTITGKAPLKITLGKPELAAIVFNGQLIDMSTFNVGNIAKFTLPLSL
jgi:cytoskeleton protein RodZ